MDFPFLYNSNLFFMVNQTFCNLKRSLFFLIIFTLNFGALFSQPGSLDPGFDANGISAPDSTNYGTGMALQTDGKIVLVGFQINPTPTSNYDFVIKRLLTDGTIDTSFSSDGIDTWDLNTSLVTDNNIPYAVKIQPNGKILLAGVSGHPSNYNFAVARYNTDGTHDNSFGSSGKVLYDLTPSDVANDMTLDINGKILLAGYTYDVSTLKNFGLCRLNSGGSLDTTFGAGGIVIMDITGQDDFIQSVIELQDGRIAVCGSADNNTIVAVYLSNGQLDSNFSGDGITITAFHSVNPDMANSIVQQSDGKLVICGAVDTTGAEDFLVARYLLDGNLDTTFSTDGFDRKDMGGTFEQANDLIIQPDNSIVLGGSIYSIGLGSDFALTRYNFNGDLDSSFGTNGIGITTTENASSIEDLAIQPDLKLLAGGLSGGIYVGPSMASMAAARYDIGLYIGIEEYSKPGHILLYPNPVAETATIRYSFLKDEILNVNLQNLQGQLVKTYFTNENQSAGDHELNIQLPVDLPSGIYFVTFCTGSGSISVKILH
jgi:uncharacterized delta-60 repeat protein